MACEPDRRKTVSWKSMTILSESQRITGILNGDFIFSFLKENKYEVPEDMFSKNEIIQWNFATNMNNFLHNLEYRKCLPLIKRIKLQKDC